MQNVIVYTDGGARGNPGPAAAGAVIVAGKERLICGKYLGKTTNNFAEYSAVVLALEKILEEINLDPKGLKVEVFADSLLAVRQLRGEFKVKNPTLRTLFQKIKLLEEKFATVDYHHVPREKNREADNEVNRVLDENSKTR